MSTSPSGLPGTALLTRRTGPGCCSLCFPVALVHIRDALGRRDLDGGSVRHVTLRRGPARHHVADGLTRPGLLRLVGGRLRGLDTGGRPLARRGVACAPRCGSRRPGRARRGGWPAAARAAAGSPTSPSLRIGISSGSGSSILVIPPAYPPHARTHLRGRPDHGETAPAM